MSGFARHAVQRFLQSVVLVLAAIVLIFSMVRLAPGDPITAMTGDFPVPEQYLREVRATYGLDRSLPEQLVLYIGNVVRGDLGFSFKNRQPVLNILVQRGTNTLILAATALAFAIVVGISLGVTAATHRHSAIDNFVTALAVVGYSVPVFWLGQLLVLALALNLGLFPAQGMTATRASYEGPRWWLDVAHHLVLPALVLSLRYIALISRVTRASLLEAMTKEYLVTARAKGLPERAVLFSHAFRNALLSIVTVIGYEMSLLLSGSALVEVVFAWPGIGSLLLDSINARDYAVIQGIFLMVTISVVAINWLTDMAYGALDPRIRR